jgi:hypothetical protein
LPFTGIRGILLSKAIFNSYSIMAAALSIALMLCVALPSCISALCFFGPNMLRLSSVVCHDYKLLVAERAASAAARSAVRWMLWLGVLFSSYGVNSTNMRIVSTFRPSSRIAF